MHETPTSRTAVAAPVVVGVDGSTHADIALRWAATQARTLGVPLRVVHAWTIPAVALAGPATLGPFVDPAPFAEAGLAVLDDAIDRLRAELGDRCPAIEAKLVEGTSVDALLERSSDASLLVVGSRGRGGFASLVLGSVADGCLHGTTGSGRSVPVAVVRGDRIPSLHGDVVVGVDDTDTSRQVLRWATIEAGRRGARLVVVHARDVHDAGLRNVRDDAFLAAGRKFVDRLLEATAGTAGKPSAVSWRVVDDAASKALIEVTEHAALLVVGDRDHGHPRRSLRALGPVSRQVTHHAHCPVVVVPIADPALELAS